MNELRKLSRDLCNGTVSEFSVSEANDKLRNYIVEVCGGKFTPNTFRKHQYEIYELMSELLTDVTLKLSRETFEPIAEFKDTDFGDKIEFIVENPDLFEVSVIASGTNDLMRQKLMNGRVPTISFDLGVKIYNEFTDFVTGRIDWDKCVEKVGQSFNHKLAEIIGKEWNKAYSSIDSNLKVTGTFDEAKLITLVQKVASYSPTGKAVVYGAKTALARIPDRQYSDADAKDKREQGFLSLYNGVKCVELQNPYDLDTNTWALEEDVLFILPEGVKPIMMGFEGDAFVDEDKSGSRLDRQIEHLMTRKVHLGVLKSRIFGVYDYSS